MERTKFKDGRKEIKSPSSAKNQKRKRQKKAFEKYYDKIKPYEFPADFNKEKHIYLPKTFINLNGLNKSGTAIYPVLCSLADFKKNDWFQESRENIALMTGSNSKTINKGIENLLNFAFIDDIPLLERRMIINGKRHFYIYHVSFIRQNMMKEFEGEYFIFYTSIIESGTWSKLTFRAKALYLAMRSNAKFDPQAYQEQEDISYSQMSDMFGEEYRSRGWDICEMSLASLCKIANINPSHIDSAISLLEKYHLIQCFYRGFKVFVNPYYNQFC